jgi:hypothetical protein
MPIPPANNFYTGLVDYVLIEGFNSTNALIGNIDGFVYNNSYIIKNVTTKGLPWYKATVFYNYVGVPLNNYFDNDYFSNLTTPSNNRIGFYIYGTNGILANFNGSKTVNYTNGYYSFAYNLKYPYFITTTNALYTNYSIGYIPQICPSYHLYTVKSVYPNAVNLTVFGLTTASVKTATSNYTLYSGLGSGNYLMLGNGYGIYSNAMIFNAMQTWSVIPDVFCQRSQYIDYFYYGNVLAYNGLFPQIFYSIIPAYTTNAVFSNVINYNVIPNNPTNVNYTYAITVNDIQWTYSLTTIANFTQLDTPYTYNFYSDTVRDLILTFPYEYQMGDSCTNLNLYSGKSPIPFYLYNCSNSDVTLLVSNLALNGDNFNSLVVKYGTTVNIGGYSNSTVRDNWLIGQGSNYVVTSNAVPYIITLNAPLNIGSNIILSSVAGAGNTGIFNKQGLIGVGSPLGTLYNGIAQNDQTFLVTDPSLAGITTYDLAMADGSGGFQVLSNATLEGSPHVTFYHAIYLDLINGERAVTAKLATNCPSSVCTVSAPQIISQNATKLPQSNSTPNVTQLVTNTTFSNNAYNSMLVNLKLTGNIKVSGISVPSSDVFLTLLIVSMILIIGGAMANSTAPLIFGFIMLWLVGIFTVSLLVLAIFVTVIYLVFYVAHRAWIS